MRVRATDASRGFSALLTRVAAGETVEIDRHGQVVAVVSPPLRAMVRGSALLELVERLPHPDDRFGEDVGKLREVTTAPREPWPS